MITKEIPQVFKDALKGMTTDLTFYWPNVDTGEPSLPYVEFVREVNGRESRTLGGEVKTERGSINLIVVSELNGSGGENTGADFGDDLADLFPRGTSYSITGGYVEVTGEPEVRQGYPTNSDWRTPVVIPYTARGT